ncbi:DUF58 domain-containing protein [Leptothrix discophora]|uniref:DUF58 domain-containing protein n=1 Tax=Leptothrix discophora TaxID=89 RepID=A0ABT9G1X6_LEPDI|nr:DUF58 domain-containing protein [Leptothrix discophora]MDP4300471.1 DUF58 domain-containing protein [Leptothrix discophora]
MSGRHPVRQRLRERLIGLVWPRRRLEAAPAAADEAAALPAAGGARAFALGPADALLRRLEWTVLRRLDGLLQGDCRTLMRGAGLDLADLREYQPHDDVRHIDWNVTARVDIPHVRQFQEDRDMTAVFLLDLSASVDWGSVLRTGVAGEDGGVRTKQQVATELVALLARLYTRAGHRVGAQIYRQADQRAEELPARGGRTQVLQLIARMARSVEPAAAVAPAPRAAGWFRRGKAAPAASVDAAESTRLADLLGAAEHRLRRRTTVVVVSDFISQPGWQAPLGRLALRHDVVAVRLGDPSEHALPAMGLVLLRDAESGEELLIDTDDPALRARHAALAAEREAALRQGLAAAGVDTLELDTAEPLLDALRRFLDLRRVRQRQGAAGSSLAGGAARAVPNPDAPRSR